MGSAILRAKVARLDYTSTRNCIQRLSDTGVITLLISFGTLSLSAQRLLTEPSGVFVSASLSSRQSLAPFPPPCPHLCASSPICFSVSSLCIPTTPGSEQKIFKPRCLFLTAPLPSKSQGAKPSHPTWCFREYLSHIVLHLDCKSLGSQTLTSTISAGLWLLLKSKWEEINCLQLVHKTISFLIKQCSCKRCRQMMDSGRCWWYEVQQLLRCRPLCLLYLSIDFPHIIKLWTLKWKAIFHFKHWSASSPPGPWALIRSLVTVRCKWYGSCLCLLTSPKTPRLPNAGDLTHQIAQ